ncbi:MAG: ATP-binding protein, partial [Flavobacteriales bacterium]
YPSREITDPEFFVGRQDEIRKGILALQEEGSFIAIHGLRGVGKSSIAQQIRLIATGSTILPKMLKLNRFLPSKPFDFIVIYISADQYVRDTSDLIKRFLFGDNNNASLFSYTKTGDRKIEQIKEVFNAGGAARLMGFGIEASGSEEISYSTHLSDDLVQQFKTILGIVKKDNQSKSGILLLVDEFDVIKDKTGFSSLVKTCSDDIVKFGICGIANSITELIVNHTSIGRQLHSIEVEKMPKEELLGIIKRAEHHISNSIVFTSGAKEVISNQAEGFPYFIHLLGKQALLDAFEEGKKEIDGASIDKLNKHICDGRLNTIYEDIYHQAVKSSPQRELLLKLFAEEDADEIFTESVYKSAKDLEVSNPSQLMKELTQPQGELTLAVLVKVREQYYRFTDPVFKVYTRIRNWKYR